MKWTLLIILSICATAISAQDQVVNESPKPQAEFNVAINPLDSNNIIITTMHGFDDVTNSYITIYYTTDFGATWNISEYKGMPGTFEGAGDPVVDFDGDGNAYLVNLAVTPDIDIQTIISKSSDQGETWSHEFTYGFFTDKPWLAIDKNNTSAHYGNIYIPVVSDNLVLLAVNDEFELLREPVIPDGNHIPSVAVDKSGDIFVSDLDWDSPNKLYFQHYQDAGAHQVHSTFITEFPDYTFDADDISFRFQPCPYIAVDNSDGPYAGRIYLTYTASESEGERFFDVFLTYSDDQGQTWSTPRLVHSDATARVQQFYSSLYVNNQGTLIVDWYDRKNFGANSGKTDFFVGVSNDGGENFSEVKVTSQPMDFEIVAPAGFGFGIGEYHQVVATDHTAVSFWSDGRSNDGDLNIYFAKVNIANPTTGVLESGIINDAVVLSNIYPQPVSESLNLDLELNKKRNLKYQIIGLNGKILSEGIWGVLTPGSHTLEIPINLSPGTYVLSVLSEKGFVGSLQFVKI